MSDLPGGDPGGQALRHRVRARTFVVPVLVLWTLAAAALVWQACRRADAMAVHHAILAAREAFAKDVSYRSWAAGHGGVYVPVTPESPPNPYLADIPERDITTPSGRHLTLVNPTYMTRQVFEAAAQKGRGPFGHITSLNLLRPENAPENWEAEALRTLEQGAAEVSLVQQIRGEPHLRLMSPLRTELSCLKCHATQGYRVGDLRGGISTTVPMSPFLAAAHAEADWMGLVYGLIWLVGAAGILLAGASLRRSLGERRQAEEALRESKDLLQQSQAVARVGHYVLDVPAGTWSSSETLDEIFGIGPEHPRTVAGWLGLIRPDEVEQMRRYFGENVLRDRQAFDRDYHIVRPSDGAVRCVHGRGKLEFAADGRPLRMFGVIQDITEREQAEGQLERALTESNRRADELQALLRAARAILEGASFAETARRIFDECRQATGATSGYVALLSEDGARNEVLFLEAGGQPCTVDPSLPMPIRGLRDRACRERAVVVENDFMHSEWPVLLPAGHVALRNLMFAPLVIEDHAAGVVGLANKPEDFMAQDAEVAAAMGNLMAIALKRAKAEQELSESEARFRNLFEQDAAVKLILDPESGAIIDANQAAVRFYGWPHETLTTMRIEQINTLSPDQVQAAMAAALSRQRNCFQFRHRLADGSVRDVEVFSSGIKIKGKSLLYSIVIDVTEEKRLAGEKSLLEEQLRQAQKVEAIGRLAGGVAHDFNNLTAIVLGYGEMLLGQVHAEDPKHKYVQQIVEAGRRSAVLTRQLLAFSRKQTLQPEVLDLNALLRNLEQMLGRVIGENIDLKFLLAASPGRVKADPGQIEQAVTNLVLNARDAMPLGGSLTVETADVDLDAAYAATHRGAVPGSYVMLALADTGGGMDQAVKDRLFEPFFTTKPKGKGTGLGLATTFGIVKQSGGYIWVDSEPDSGTTFRIYLPRTDEELTVKAGEAVGAIPRGRGERVLLVEDQAPLRGLCETVLSHLGYRVVSAANGLEALELVRAERLTPDLVITDVIMPDMSGAEMAERLRRDRPGLKVLFMSGYTDDAIARHGVLEPGMHFIEKPFTERVLAFKVRETLGVKTQDAAAAAPGRRVLMVDDDEQFRELVRHFCTKRGHTFAGVDSAAAALTALAQHGFDVLLVDLNIPGTSGERVLHEIRAAGHRTPAIVLTGDAASADMAVLGPLGVVRALQKSSDGEPLLQAIEAAVPRPSGGDSPAGPPPPQVNE